MRARYRVLRDVIVPVPAGLIVQVTLVFDVLPTAAANCWVWPPYNETLTGVTLTETGGLSVMVAEAFFVDVSLQITSIIAEHP